MDIIPAVDILDGAAVRLLKGDYSAVTSYDQDPVRVASRWIDQGAAIVHVVDLMGARTAKPSEDLWRELGEAGVAFQIGGGIRTVELAQAAIESGAARVVVGSAAVHKGGSLESIIEGVGPERVVAAIDVRAGRARGSGWLDEGEEVGSVVDRVVRAGVRHALVTGIETDGAMLGPNTQILDSIASQAPDLALIASGGVGSIADIVELHSLAIESVIVGKALYENRFTLEEALAAATSRS